MMPQILKTAVYSVLFFSFAHLTCFGQVNHIPSDVKQYLDKNYNSWQLVEAPYYDSTGMVQGTSREKGANFTSSDYDGNGKEDYALMFEFEDTSRQNRKGFKTLVLMSVEDGFNEFQLSGGCSYDCVLSTLSATYDVKEVYTDEKIPLENPAIIIAFLGKAASVYYYSNDEFIETQIAD